MYHKKLTNKILHSIRAKLAKRTIIVLVLIAILVIPTVITENENIPQSNENLFYIVQSRGDGLLFKNNSFINHGYRNALILNGTLYPQPHIGLCIRVNAQFSTCDGLHKYEHFNITRLTNSRGIVNLSLINVVDSQNLTKGLGNNCSYSLVCTSMTCSIENKYLRGNEPGRLVCTHIICDPFINSSSRYPGKPAAKELFNGNQTAQLYYDDLPAPQLGYYGITPIFYLEGNFTKNVNIGYKSYSSTGTLINRSNLTLTSLGVGELYIDRNYTQLKAFNEASSVIFYANGHRLEFNLFGGFGRNVFNLQESHNFLILFAPSEVAILIGLFMAIVLFYPMYDENVYRKYLSLPHKRSQTILIELFSSFILGSIVVIIGSAVAYLLSPAIGGNYISFNAILFTYAIFTSSFFLMASLFSIIGAYFPGQRRPVMFLAIGVGLGYILLRFFSNNLIFGIALPNLRFLYKPNLDLLRNYTILNSVSPIFDIKEMNDYLTHTMLLSRNFSYAIPVMYNHINIFDLSPILFLSSMIFYIALLLFIGIRKYKRL